MRTPRLIAFPAASLFAASLFTGALLLLPAAAQDPAPPPPPTPAGQGSGTQDPPPTKPEAAKPDATKPEANPEAAPEGGDGQRRRRRPPPMVLEAGTVHPVAGPAIADGVVVIRGERIVAVGKKGEVEVPPNAVVRSFPTAHVYPGLVDALTDAFTDDSLRNDGESDGGAPFGDDLRLQHKRSDQLAAAGITTAYIAPRSPSLVRGQGAIVRPTKDGFDPWSGRDRAGLQVRMAAAAGPSHALQRQQQLQAVDALFEGLEEFRKAKADHKEALTKYEKEFAEYLAFHEKKKGDGKGAPGDGKAGGKPAGDKPAGEGPGAERPAGPPPTPPIPAPDKKDPPKQADEPSDEAFAAAVELMLAALAQDPPKPEPPKQDPKAQDPQKPPERVPPGAPEKPADKKDEGPKRPTYPKPPAKDPQRDALLQVLDGDLPLRVEAHRLDELRAAIRLQQDRSVPQLIVEGAYAAGGLAKEMAAQGVAAVLTETLPMPMAPPFDQFDRQALPQQLEAAAVPFALASGSARQSHLLPLMAATAVGRGLSAEAALRAITLTPAELLGVAKDTGSLVAGKYADVLVVDRPLFQTDSRVLLVLGRGRTEFEGK